MYILMTKTTLGYQLKACGTNRHAARYAGIKDKRNIVLSMAIAGALSGARRRALLPLRQHGVLLADLPGPARHGLQRHPRRPARGQQPDRRHLHRHLHVDAGHRGPQLTALTPFNEYITDVIIATIVYLSAFSLVIKMLISGGKKRKKAKAAAGGGRPGEPEPETPTGGRAAQRAPRAEKGGEAE